MTTAQSGSTITWRPSPSRLSLERLSNTARALESLATTSSPGAAHLQGEVILTLQQEAAKLRSMVHELTGHLRAEALIATISNRLLNLPLDDLSQGVDLALAELGKISTVQRAYVFLLSDDASCLADAYEWTAEDVAGHDFDSFRGTPVTAFPWSMAQFRRGETIFVDDPSALPREAEAERAACESLNIRSYVNMPLFAAGQLIGWLGFDAVTTHKEWSDEELRFMVIAGDIIVNAIQRKRRDEMLFRQRELNQRITSMGTLAAGLAHEINNPLSFVVGNLSYLRDMIDECPGVLQRVELDEMGQVLAHAREGADRVRRIVGDLRALAIGEETDIGEVTLDTIIDSTLRMASNQLHHRATVVREYAGAPPVVANPSQLGQVLLNLVLNAAHALPEGRAAENTITVSARGAGDEVHIAVEDTGCGIAPEVLPRIFDPFFTTRKVGDGMGMGLAICHHLVKSFGGSIDIASQVGKGTRVRIVLRRAQGTGVHAADPRAARAKTKARRILMVDDEPMVLDLLGRVLKGNELVRAENGREALDRIAENPDFDIIFCDLMMPELTGMDVYMRLRAEHPGAEERIVFISGGTFTKEMRAFIDSVPNPKLDKPFDTRAVRQIVSDMPRLAQSSDG